MLKTDTEAIIATVLTTILALSMLVPAIIVLLPAHSDQARPRLSHLTVPTVPPELDRRHQEQKATYRDLNNPDRQLCADPTPHGEEEPRSFYVTVAEGDRKTMLDLISYNARINDSLVRPLYDGWQISYHDGWEAWLVELNPAIDRNHDRIHQDYTHWAEHAADNSKPTAPQIKCAALPKTIRIYVDEQNVGGVSDESARNAAVVLIMFGTVTLIVSILIYISARLEH